jgi:uncharacterized lipoprotein YmbA
MTPRCPAPSTHRRIAPPIALIALAAAGCGLLRGPNVQPTQFYVLTAVAQPSDASPSSRQLIIGLGPVKLPDYLNRPEMVSRVTPNELRLDQFDRWGEPLKDNFIHTLATNLDTLLNLRQVVSFPWYSNTPMDYTVVVTVLRFEPQPEGQVLLSARWEIGDTKGHALVNRDSQFTRPGGTPAETAAALSQLVADLSDEIASALRGVASQPSH